MYTNDRNAYRQAFYTAWQKYKKKLVLEKIEAQMVDIILLHPEYHALLEDNKLQEQEYNLEENPFFHMSLHIAVREQLQMDRPQGICAVQAKLLAKYKNAHDVEHMMLTCLAQLMWDAQASGTMPDEQEYVEKLRKL